MRLERLFYPRGVAVVGSMSAGKLGAALVQQIQAGGFTGDLFAVNPKGEGAFSIPGYSSIAQIEHPVDLVVIASPAATVASVLDDCGEAGVPVAVVITAGFSEMGNAAGEEEILRVARRNGVRLVGPNSAGIVCTSQHLFPTLEVHPPSGEVALISQSGALGGVVLAAAAARGLGISKFVSYGNRADLTEADFLHYLTGDAETRVVALYVESVSDGRAFMDALDGCSRVKPVVIIKAGRTLVGQRATASHTGAMAGSDAVYEAAIRQCGAMRVRSVDEMLDLCAGFASLPAVRGRRLAIVTNSGGPGVLAADRAEEAGLQVGEPSPEARARLREFLPAHASIRNPIDLTVEGTPEGYRRSLLSIMDEYDAALAIDVGTPYLDSEALAQGVAAAAAEIDKPVAANFLPVQLAGSAVELLRKRGIPNYPSGERAVEALAAMSRYAERRQDASRESRPRWSEAQAAIALKELPGGGQMLEPEAMAWLRENDIAVPEFHFVKGEEEALQACQAIGYPVVMKVVSPQILHKSELGGVVVGVANARQVSTAYAQLRKAAEGKDFRGVVIYPQVRGGSEVLVGLSRDAQFGPVIAFGLGGIYTEIWKDVSLRVAPVDLAGAREMIHAIRSVPLLEGARGEQPRDLDALAELLVKVSQLPFLYPEIGELDLNPVFLLPKGLVVGDVRVIRRKSD